MTPSSTCHLAPRQRREAVSFRGDLPCASNVRCARKRRTTNPSRGYQLIFRRRGRRDKQTGSASLDLYSGRKCSALQPPAPAYRDAVEPHHPDKRGTRPGGSTDVSPTGSLHVPFDSEIDTGHATHAIPAPAASIRMATAPCAIASSGQRATEFLDVADGTIIETNANTLPARRSPLKGRGGARTLPG